MTPSGPLALLCDLDGVVYRGDEPCPGAPQGLAAAREAGLRVLFVTNNAGHTPEGVARRLETMGVQATPEEVLTSSMVAADYVARRLPRPADDSVVLAVGGEGVRTALERQGLSTVDAGDLARDPSLAVRAVVQGYGPAVCVADLTEAVYAVRAGATWVATNTDATLPTERGEAPGNGALLAAVAKATGREPDVVVGKPHAPTYELALRLLDVPPASVLAVGDRLETDIEGANRAGLRTALVTTGVHGPADVAAAAEAMRPDRVVATLLDLDLAPVGTR